MNKEVINPIEQSTDETSDSCPRCGNTLVTKQESNQTLKYCITESFDLKLGKITSCGFSKIV